MLNRELGADFDLDAFSYVPFWDPHMERMDLRLRAEMPQRVTIPGADLVFDLASGEEIRVEISTKFRPEGIAAELDRRRLHRHASRGPTTPATSRSPSRTARPSRPSADRCDRDHDDL